MSEPNYKVIHFHLFDPNHSIFKSKRNGKAECQIIECCRSEDCGLFKKGQCTYRRVLGWERCHYGRYRVEYGLTKRAKGFYKWIEDKKKEFEGIGYLDSHNEVMAIIGDYVFLPYSHMNMCKEVPFKAHGGAFVTGASFISLEEFTPEVVTKLLNFKPQALFGGEITTYQTESVPKFLHHLSELMPDLYTQVKQINSRVQGIEAQYTNVKRKAKLYTLKTNAGKFKDIHGGEWIWDGEWLISKNSHASFLLVSEFDELRIRPKESAIVEITDDVQVTDKTEFID